MEGKRIRLSAPGIDASILFGIYINLPKNADKDISLNDFIIFLSAESVDRELFLNKYCIYEFIEKEDSIILRYKVKE